MLKVEEIERLYQYVIAKSPFILIDNSVKGFEEATIRGKIQEAWDLIPIKCLKRRDDIVMYLVIHLLLRDKTLLSDWENGDNSIDEKLLTIDTGDIKTTVKDRDNQVPILFRGSRFGAMAHYLIRLCSRSRVGIIV
jgi:hypothetical protein